MTKMTPLLERNEQFASGYTPAGLGLPATQLIIVTCLDHRIDPALALGLQLGDAPVIRNVGGRVTQAVIDDIAFLAVLTGQLSGGQGAADALFEVAVIHHTQCGTGFLADPGFRRPTSSACSPHPCCPRRSAFPATCTTSPPDGSPPQLTPGTHSCLAGRVARASIRVNAGPRADWW